MARVLTKKGRPKTYCSKECKKEWEVKHPILYRHECYYCGKKFESKTKSADYCCHKCYIRDRFWRDEDIETVIKHLRKGTPVPNAPGWVKDLIAGRKCRQSGEKEADVRRISGLLVGDSIAVPLP